MTPAEEIEYIIKEITEHKIDDIKSYTIKSFPEICLLKRKFNYVVEIMKDYRQNDDVNERFKELIDEIRTRKITIENRIVEKNNSIALRGDILMALVPIYYKECIFTYPHTLIGTNCENCIVEKR